MAKSRYFYCLFLMNSLINIINFVPRELIDRRFGGALMSILIGTILGTLFVYIFTVLIAKFPGKGFPEIFDSLLPKKLARILLVLFAGLWCVAGGVTLLSFVDITLRFISPDSSPYTVVISFLVLVCICCRFDSLSLLYGLEIILSVSLPLIIYGLVKALTNPDFNWDSVLQVTTYFWHKPDLMSLAAATFSFSGYLNLAIFNRVFHGLKLKHAWILGVEGLFVLLLTFLVPIGYFGTVAIDRHVYTWFSTADSIRMESFIIERMLFIFYFTYLSLSLVSVIVHWHGGLELFKGALSSVKKQSPKAEHWKEWGILGLFSAMVLSLMGLDQYQLNMFGAWFLQIRWFGEMFIIALLFYCYRKVRRGKL
ncbi:MULTISPECIES: GerAB/ArcD/ProY family transporter [Paenibacillus]|uniref:GerAB/ArcD/ProY family transporter n=1 Tax=Paenibacillus TaxID=44249 RepID=UPI0003E2083F|nr:MULTISPECIES: GerAB/ArcD/ProY family transporter [Paenibacillus]ETT59436.1 hypothetical protein C171_14484 [Paenibacillus sp. FSL H8-237]OMD12368.1 hypothetical protein BJP47_03810 [Paenibacillus odorifer]OMD13048.1 hypothetical protein BJP50_01910 [Paenibacillus odorifer]OME35126.1 hypothetical protein BSK63_06405 [Paenibacillus odorifer]OME42529.1 hypothetical protein BSK46_01630 [Paenibacillus odorifer]